MLRQLHLTNYRNIPDLHIDLQGNSNAVIIGDNGSGKSNVLEAIYLAGRGHSFKPLQHLLEVIGPDKQFARIEMQFEFGNVECIVSQTEAAKLSRIYKLNSKRTSLSHVRERVPIILFAPQSMDLADKDPGLRREDLDEYLSMQDPNYEKLIDKYHQVVQNRNALLKHLQQYPHQKDQLQFWDEQGADLGGKIIDYRQKYFSHMEEVIQRYAPQIYEDTHFNISYQPDILAEDNRQAMWDSWTKDVQKQIIIGRTLHGPHKDDYILELNNRNLRYLGSRGEQRMGILIWKLIQYRSLHAQGQSPILLIDDLMSELDPRYQDRALNLLRGEKDLQFILTIIKSDLVPRVSELGCQQVSLGGLN